MLDTGSSTTVMALCTLALAMLLGSSISRSFFSVAQSPPESYCELPIDKERIKVRAHNNLEIIQTEGNYIRLDQVNVKKIHFTCLASRGIGLYSSASLVAELLVAHRTWKPNSTRDYQFQMSCVKGKWGSPKDRSSFDRGGEEQLFEIPLEKQCFECEENVGAYMHSSYDRRSNCFRKRFYHL